ncbi:MAG: hypothetical protein GYA21_12550 [Myxococcales bacterium]|nr:hypothetical protein [Myxococcales bacterium]
MRKWLVLGALGILCGCQCADAEFSTCRLDKECGACEHCAARRCVQDEEICDDDLDNDCDGKTDENCGNACYGVACDQPPPRYCLDRGHLLYYRVPGHCGPFGLCGYDAVEVECAGGCRDGACADDVCVGLFCPDDRNPCTDDDCDPVLGCTHTDNTHPCEDGDACTVGDVCSQGRCQYGSARVCDDGIACTRDYCAPATGCERQPQHELCDDGDLCTSDACDPASGCVHGFNQEPCDDEDECTMGEACAEGVCAGGLPKDQDGDGFVDKYCGGDDCEDDSPESHPGGVEVCDGADNDCDGLTDVLGIDPSDPCRVQAICVGGVPVDCPAAVGPTVAPSIIDSQALWCAAGSPYLVESSLVVTEQGSLTVGPCVEVRVGDGASIYCNGELRVLASSGKPARFTSDSSSPEMASWKGIELRDTATNQVLLSGAVVEFAEEGLRFFGKKTGPIRIIDSVFQKNFTALRGQHVSPVEIRDTSFLSNQYGVRVSRVDFRHCTFRGNGKAVGINPAIGPPYESYGENWIIRCIVEGNGVGIEDPLGYVFGCSIVGNSEAGIQWSLGGGGMPVEIRKCTIAENNIGLFHDDQGWVQHPLLRDNIICRNRDFDVKMHGWHELDATENYWCTTDPDEIAARICDIHEDASLGEVVFVPFLERAP